jgi:hypothetical protein
MSESPENAQKRVVENAVKLKMLSKMGFTEGQEISWYEPSGGGEQMTFWVQGIELEISEDGTSTGLTYSVNLGDLPLVELLNKSNENPDSPFEVGTAVNFEVSESSGDYRIRSRKFKSGTVVGIKVATYDNRLRPSSFDPQFLKTKISSGGYKRKTRKSRRNRRRNTRRN